MIFKKTHPQTLGVEMYPDAGQVHVNLRLLFPSAKEARAWMHGHGISTRSIDQVRPDNR
jgi:hypothetical protein